MRNESFLALLDCLVFENGVRGVEELRLELVLVLFDFSLSAFRSVVVADSIAIVLNLRIEK